MYDNKAALNAIVKGFEGLLILTAALAVALIGALVVLAWVWFTS